MMINSKRVLYISMLLFSLLLNSSCKHQGIEGLSFLDGKPVRVEVKDGMISRVKNISKLTGKGNHMYIAPGLIDNQVNGFAGISFSLAGGELTVEGVKQVTRSLWEYGVTSYLPTLTTNDREILLANLYVLSKAKNEQDLLGSIPGFHLEGPYISPVDGYRGAHPKMFVREPDWVEFMELYEASGRNILTVTVAPEIPGGLGFIRQCSEMGIIVALGHHNASAETIDEAVQNGARICTHLGNGCANMINRHKNPLWPQLARDELMISIICDGIHLLPEEIKVFHKVKGTDKTIITSDVTSYATLPPGEYFTPEGDTIVLTPDQMIYYPAQNVLYGSASPITRGVGHIMEVTGCSLADAFRMASTNPAKLYGLTDRGTMEKGKRADLILFTVENSEIKIHKTYVRGELVFQELE
jgi:N-acetylglucosamine-6-phosphate deacetylase